MTPHRILFTGSRTYSDETIVDVILTGLRSLIWSANFEIDGTTEFLDVAHGAAAGLDSLVDQVIPVNSNVRVHRYPAAWRDCDHAHPVVPCPPGREHRHTILGPGRDNDYCPLAGPRRNQTMLDDFKPDLVIAFFDKPYDESKGTKDMVERAALANVNIHIIGTGGRP